MAQKIFKRLEKKYILTRREYETISAAVRDNMLPDKYSDYSVHNIYFDTPDYTLARASTEKPLYKEKLRLRSYRAVNAPDDMVFAEIKKKYDKTVYKRRIQLPYKYAPDLMAGNPPDDISDGTNGNTATDRQIISEISFFANRYNLKESTFLSYDRQAFSYEDELRLTFDTNIRYRPETNLAAEAGGKHLPITAGEDDCVLMEIKTPFAYPMWLCDMLSRNKIYPASFSKYGTCYKQYLLPKLQERLAAIPVYIPAKTAVKTSTNTANTPIITRYREVYNNA